MDGPREEALSSPANHSHTPWNQACHNIDEQAINLTISIGVACYMPNQTLKNFIKRADDAIYQAKQQGRNRVVTAYELSKQNKAS